MKQRVPDRFAEAKTRYGVSDSSREGRPQQEIDRLVASNQLLSRDVTRLESERDALIRELRYVTRGYSWKMIGGYRRWLARHKEAVLVRLCESLTLWTLARIYGTEEPDHQKRYQQWINAHRLTPERLDATASEMATFPYQPLIRVQLWSQEGSNDRFLHSAIDSLRRQLYQNWLLCVTKPTGDDQNPTSLGQNTQDRPNEGSDSKEEGFVVALDSQGELSPEALFEIVRQLNRDCTADLIYWDEDRLDANGTRHKPFFKPDWSPNLILSTNYVGQSFAVRRSLIDQVGGMGSNPYDLILRASERARSIIHIPKILYHGRYVKQNKSESEAIEQALQRRAFQGRVIPGDREHYHVRYQIPKPPLVSVLIPTRDRRDLLERCIDSVLNNTTYPNFEIIILDNDSCRPETVRYFRRIGDRATIVRCPGPFNYSVINNHGVAHSRGELVLFLNNDTQVISPEWMTALVEQAQRSEVGAVGAKLLFKDGRIQHAGLVLGIEASVAHAFHGMPKEGPRSHELANVIRDCSAVTGACLMMRRALFEELGGFERALPVDFNDVDLCLRLRMRGYLVVYTPLAVLYHQEGASRSKLRFDSSHREVFLQRWRNYLSTGDPYYNRHLSLAGADWKITI